MIDFKNKSIFKLTPMDNNIGYSEVKEILINDEKVISAFRSMRDKLIFTNKRIIAINIQGLTGKKVDYTSIPYKKIQTFSIETAGTFDLDSELDIVISGLGTIRFELSKGSDIRGLGVQIASSIL